jgi:hypothetical protein
VALLNFMMGKMIVDDNVLVLVRSGSADADNDAL